MTNEPRKRRWLYAGLLLAGLVALGLFIGSRSPQGSVPSTPGAAPKPPAHPTRLVVATQPSGASVFLNGQLAGATPLELVGLAPGVYGLRLERAGCIPANRRIELACNTDLPLSHELHPLPAGILEVKVEPAGAEVLLDGEFIGHTPLRCSAVQAGNHELLVRKTNYQPFSKDVTISPEEPSVFAGFGLRDKMLEMLQGTLRSEPQRLAHYLDLGHYLFLDDRMDEAADIYTQGMNVMQTPLDFDGPGYNGKENMSEQEIAVEQRLRKEDSTRFQRELDKHRSWPRKDTRAFKKKIDEAQDLLTRRNIGSWIWADAAARLQVKGDNYAGAAKIYSDHIAAAPNSPELAKACAALLEINLAQRNVPAAKETFGKLMAAAKNDGAQLAQCGTRISSYQDRMQSEDDRRQALEMAEKALRRAAELLPASAVARAQAQCDLATVLMFQNHPAEAVKQYQAAVAATSDPLLKDQRSLRLAEALRRAGKPAEARALYTSLATSKRADIRESAKAGLIYITKDEAGKK